MRLVGEAQYFCILHADDKMKPNYMSSMLEFTESHPNATAGGTIAARKGIIILDEEKKLFTEIVETCFKLNWWRAHKLARQMSIIKKGLCIFLPLAYSRGTLKIR